MNSYKETVAGELGPVDNYEQYPCDQCEYKGSNSVELWRHKKSKHEGLTYSCDECDYAGSRLDTLTRHKRAKHEGRGVYLPKIYFFPKSSENFLFFHLFPL